MVRKEGLEPPWVSPPDPKSGASANSATLALQSSGSALDVSAMDTPSAWKIIERNRGTARRAHDQRTRSANDAPELHLLDAVVDQERDQDRQQRPRARHCRADVRL